MPGAESGEILVTAICPVDAESLACAAIDPLIADLRRTPLRRDVRVLLFRHPASFAEWLEARGDALEPVVGALHHVSIDGAGEPQIVQTLPVVIAGERRLAPGWLVHAVLRGGEAVGRRPSMADDGLPFVAQLVLRASRRERRSAAEELLGAGTPALSLTSRSLFATAAADGSGNRGSEPSDLEAWGRLSAAAVRRLDVLEGRPRSEDRYLVALGRVWLRRDLYWLGFGLWVALVLQGLPGRWRGATGADRRARGRTYLPGLAFRALYLASLFMAPEFAVPLLAPAAIASLAPSSRRGLRVARLLLGMAPSVAFAAALATALAIGAVDGLAAVSPAPWWIGATLVAFFFSLGDPRMPAPAATR